MKLEYRIKAENNGARTGFVKLRGKKFRTPAFLPVATLGSVRALDFRDLREIGVEIIMANTFHLHLKPGDDLVKKLGGLHKFMNFDGVIATDSGGFQVFSLGLGMEHGIGKIADNIFLERMKNITKKEEKWIEIDEEGITFRNPINGSKMRLTPKKSMEIQSNLGSDIIFAFDECTSPLSDKDYTTKALERTHRWAIECLENYDRSQAIFGIVQGGEYKELRIKSAIFISSLDFDGFGIGGSLGKSKKDMLSILEWVVPVLPEEKPRHLLGIGAIEDIFNCVEKGVDMFDCVSPTRWARRGHLYVSPGSGGKIEKKFRIHIKNSQFREDESPIDDFCDCFVCKNYSRAYLHHLFTANELTYFRLSAFHNLYFMIKLMEEIRKAIEGNYFLELKKEWFESWR
ncbi:MAG: tRNA guanosine(34) transglycosylase Tgt [Archaeoglobaceae archaeon]|nr:tRNA guanosine(34) transglycosylase Tgt [Archaeoglobaceae archaeon]MDW7989526.1 tRNA guanosine(34) transglycosylase Tgt [Archaeoglobaceae archaeon]